MTNTKLNILGVIAVVLGWWTSEMTLAVCALFGAALGVTYNLDFIKEYRLKGIVISVGSLLFPVLFTQALMALASIEEFSIGNLIAMLSGLVAFGFVRFVMENQTGIVMRIINLIFKKTGEQNASS